MFVSRSERMSQAARAADLHEIPDFRAGKRVPLQSLPDSSAQDRNCARALPHRETDQNLVPEPTHEVKERTARRKGNQRAGAQGTRGAGPNEAAATGEASQAGGAAPRPPRDPPSRPDEDAHRQGLQRPYKSEQGLHVRRPHRIGDHD